MPSQNILTAQKLFSFYENFDFSILDSLLAENYCHEFGPRSINPPGPLDRAGFLAHTSGLSAVLTGFRVFVDEYIESADGRQVTVRATSKTELREEARDAGAGDGLAREEWEYGGEYVFILTMDESGEKLVKTYEFLDSLATVKLLELVNRGKGNLEKNQAKA